MHFKDIANASLGEIKLLSNISLIMAVYVFFDNAGIADFVPSLNLFRKNQEAPFRLLYMNFMYMNSMFKYRLQEKS